MAIKLDMPEVDENKRIQVSGSIVMDVADIRRVTSFRLEGIVSEIGSKLRELLEAIGADLVKKYNENNDTDIDVETAHTSGLLKTSINYDEHIELSDDDGQGDMTVRKEIDNNSVKFGSWSAEYSKGKTPHTSFRRKPEDDSQPTETDAGAERVSDETE